MACAMLAPFQQRESRMLKGRVALVTGSTSGIGLGIARALAAEGADVMLNGFGEADAIEKERASLEKEFGVRARHHGADMTRPDEIAAMVAETEKTFGAVDILVNNAGIFIPGALHEEADGHLEKLMAVNVYSAYHLTRELLPLMIAQRNGHIFNMCSTASYHAYPNGGSYSITKYALLGFSKNLRRELMPHNVRVTSVSPGPTLTASWDGFEGPADRMMPPEDIASVVWNAFTLAKQTVVEEIQLRPMLGDI